VRRPAVLVTALAALAVSLVPVGAAPPAVADHTGPAGTVTLVGSLQSELGCEADWAPACEDTRLAPAGDGTWSADLEVPAGTWEYKVAIDGGWDESHGGGADGSANIPLHLEHPVTLRFSYDEGSHRVAVAPVTLPGDAVTPADRARAGDSLRTPLTRERFYFVMADRFANGDPSNDHGGLTGSRLDHGHDPTDKGFFHGGDVAGLLDRLDYVQDLGTTAIWLTPSFQNRPVQGSGPDASAGYHGYWVTDFTRIDPHFATNAELKQLVDAAHARGIKVFFDIITNHTADVLDYAEQEYSYVSKETRPYRDADGREFDDAEYAGGETFPELDAATSFPYTPTFRADADRSAKTPAWLNDPTLYHNRGDSTFAGESSTYGDFIGLDDLFTEHPDVVDGMSDIYRTWVDFGIDGFRIDTVKHVNMEFWQQFAPAMRDEARRIGNDDFFAFGEVFDADPRAMSRFTTEGRLDATLDFGFQQAGVAFAKGRPTTGLRDFYAGDDHYTDTDSNAYASPTFLGNHDMGRVGHFLQQEGYGDDELLARDELAHALMYLTRGQPVVYYGDEQGFTGNGGDKDARQDMFASQVADYNDDDLVGTARTTATDSYDTTHPLYRTIRDLAALRKRYPALADGAQLHRSASDEPGVYAFSRVDRTERREYVVAVNNDTAPHSASFETLMKQGTFTPVWPASRQTVRSDAERRLEVTVPPLSAVVLRANGTVADRDEAPSAYFRTPSAGGTVGGDQEVGVAVPEGGFNQVTLAYRLAGAGEWTTLGTDDNAPYRVFHDVSGMPEGTLVEYRAVLKDSSGNLSATSTYATVGDPAPGGGDPGDGGGPVTQPDAVSMPGSHNSEIGCPGDWQPDCDQAQMVLTSGDPVWRQTVNLPAGSYEYKAAIDRSWDENYGAGGAPGGGNIPLELTGARDVTFFYDHGSHYVTTDAQGPIVTAAGSFQDELGCPGDWSPGCMAAWLKDPDGDGTFTHRTTGIPAGSYEVKAAHGLSWDENYGAGGAPGGGNIGFTVPSDGTAVVFSYDLATHVLTVTSRAAGATPDLTRAKAHWLRRDLVAWDVPAPAAGDRYRLYSSPDGTLEVDAESVTGGASVPLTHDPAGLPSDVLADVPHLAGYEAFRLSKDGARRAGELLRGQLAVASYDDLGVLTDATGVQVPGVLDDLYAAAAADRTLGASWSGGRPDLAVWAPTAQRVDLLLERPGSAERRVPMRRQDDGSWTVTGERSWAGARYTYEVRVFAPTTGRVETNRVTDPYSVALTTNSTRSLLVDLDDPALAPAGWSSLTAPAVARPVDRAVYELHVRDFSIGDDSVPAADRGTYAAFTHRDSAGMRHLRELATAGLNTVHLLPVFDIATIEERRAAQRTPQCDLPSFAPDSDKQQACVDAVRGDDGFNWGYDPYHYTAPEGSYATDPEGAGRTREFRSMVGALNRAGLQVVMDVVYNHTAQSGQSGKSVLDRVVPGYYHRLDVSGGVERSTCCENTATEHRMMEKLMIDSVLTWAREYKVNGFRFDLMGHHTRANMVRLREALDRLTVEKDGVDGRGIYLYGEGWNFGEVADDARFEQARQGNLGGTGIGTFSDRLRDAVRGGGPFDDNPRVQGFASGLFTDPNGDPVNGTTAAQRRELLHAEDLVKLGLAGNLADYTFTSSQTGKPVAGKDVDYDGHPAGYAAQPDETITYVDAHDNETIFDTLTMKLPTATSMDDRVRMNTLALATTAFSQGVSFWHAGADILRSKSLDRNSYDSGDWFNRVDWTREQSTFGSGLPLEADNGSKWPYLEPLLADPALRPTKAAMDAAHATALDLLRIRSSSRLFRLGDAAAIQQKVSFPTADPGVVAMLLDDTRGPSVDPDRDAVLVVLNASPEATTVGGVGSGWRLHEVQQGGADAVVRQSLAAGDGVTVPGRTVAVLVR
jgi:pullulanase-type alpha-1,6-glucosidase